jgi:histidinol-phosphate aminotransferase
MVSPDNEVRRRRRRHRLSVMTLPIRDAVLSSPDYPFVPIDARIKLDQNESPEDFPAPLKALVLERLAQAHWHRYTDLNSEAIGAAIAKYEDWSPAGVVVTTGSNVLIPLLIQLAALDRRVVTVTPNFALYGLDAKLLGASLTEVPLRPDFSMDVSRLLDAIKVTPTNTARTGGVVYLPQPHAPTGSIAAIDDLEKLAMASSQWLTVVDEAYHQFARVDARPLARRFPHVVLLRTFSKAWGLAGARLGYALASDDAARHLRKLVPPFAVSVMQTQTALVALENPGYMKDRVERTIQERDRLTLALKRHPTWEVFPSAANFLLIRTPNAMHAHAELLSAGVLVRRQDAYAGLEGCFRVTIGTREENDAFLRAAGL